MLRALFVVATIAIAARPISAAPATDADRAAAEADALAKAGDFPAAAAKFREGWQADKLRTDLFCNIGISYYKAKDLVRAHLLLGQCLEQAALDPKIVDAVRVALVSVEGVLRSSGHTAVRVVVDPPVTSVTVTELAPDLTFVGSRVVWLAFGSYHLNARAEGYGSTVEAITAATADPLTVTITLHKPVENTAKHALPPPPIVVRDHASRLAPIVVTATTVVAFGLATFAYIEGHARADLAATALDQPTFDADRNAVSRWNTTLEIGGGVGIAGAALATFLWYRALRTEAPVEIHASPTGAGLSFTRTF